MIDVQTVLQFLWDWLRTFFGTVFIACVIISFILLVIELIVYRIKKTGGNQS